MISIKLTDGLTLDRNKEGYTVWGEVILGRDMNVPIIVSDAPYARLSIDDKYCESFKEKLLEYKNETNTAEIDEVIADINKHVEGSV